MTSHIASFTSRPHLTSPLRRGEGAKSNDHITESHPLRDRGLLRTDWRVKLRGMNDVISVPFRRFTVTVTFEAESDMWVAVCDEIGLVTEESTFEALMARAWTIAPELAEFNCPGVDPDNMHLLFEHEQCAPALVAL